IRPDGDTGSKDRASRAVGGRGTRGRYDIPLASARRSARGGRSFSAYRRGVPRSDYFGPTGSLCAETPRGGAGGVAGVIGGGAVQTPTSRDLGGRWADAYPGAVITKEDRRPPHGGHCWMGDAVASAGPGLPHNRAPGRSRPPGIVRCGPLLSSPSLRGDPDG